MSKKIVLKKGREKSLLRRHPWIFSGAVDRIEGAPVSGETVTVTAADGTFLGYAAYSHASQITGRVWSFDCNDTIDAEFFKRRISAAAALREKLGLMNADGGCRLIFSEADQLPGVIVDRFGKFLILQLLSAGAEFNREHIVNALWEVCAPAGIHERSDVSVRRKENLPGRSGLLKGEELPDELIVSEEDMLFAVDGRKGQKTGFYFDLRSARKMLRRFSAGADILNEGGKFKYPSYVQDIMGPLFFDYGFGPFRWVCMSENPEDLAKSDAIAAKVLREIMAEAPEEIQGQMMDNIRWIEEAGHNKLGVGSQARILYADCEGRTKIALAFNEAIRKGEISAAIVLGRDHHDVSGTDSPFRETSNIYDGSQFCADMAVHNVIGDSFRGATWVSIHNGGGVGWGEVMNGGFGMVIDGSEDSDRHISEMLLWDVNNGIARRSWARNEGAVNAIRREMQRTPGLKVTLPNFADEDMIKALF